MAGPTNQVQINYDEMEDAAKKYDGYATETGTLATNCKSTYDTLTAYWVGAADNQMADEIVNCKKRLDLTQKMFTEVSAALRDTVSKIKAADEAAKGAIASKIVSDTAA